jgi:hypothetical protein
MDRVSFEQDLRLHLRREPFQPFLIELENGGLITITQPTVAFNEGFAGYLNPAYELVEFRSEDVRQIRLATKETV